MSTASNEQLDTDVVLIGRGDISDFNGDNILPQPFEVQEAIRAWLKPTAYDADNGEYRKHMASYLPGTGEWLLSSPAFRRWRDEPDQDILWVKGIPGSGKSVMAASLIHRLSKQAPVLFFFFRQIIDANHSPFALLRDWLAQVLVYSPPLQIALKKHIDTQRSLDSLSMSDMWQLLETVVLHVPRIYCVVDALDEMDSGNDEFLLALARFGRLSPSRIKVIITSRPVVGVERPLRQEPILQIRLDENMVDLDIATYVAHSLQSSSVPTSKHALIQQAVPGRANGLFLYARLAIDAFLEPGADIEQVLEVLPKDLNVMYMNLLREHGRRSCVPHELQLLILSWVTHASRPLRLLEMAEMVKVTETSLADGTLKEIKGLVRVACGPLLEILPDETVCVIHHSFTEFLNGSTRDELDESSGEYPILDRCTTHSRLAQACQLYMCSGVLDAVNLVSEEDYEDASEWDNRKRHPAAVNRELPLQHPFLSYSLDNWHVHARKADASGQVPESLLASIRTLLSGRNFEALTTLCDGGSEGKEAMHVAAQRGLCQFVERLIQEDGLDADMVDDKGRTPIYHAAKAGMASVVKLLLAHGAKPDKPSAHDGKTPLHEAAIHDHGDAVSLLLDAGVDPLTKKTKASPDFLCGDMRIGDTPLMYAAMYGCESATAAFLPHLNSDQVNQALSWAADSKAFNVVPMILEHPAVDVNSAPHGSTPLFFAARQRDLQLMITLLKAGANPSILSHGCREDQRRSMPKSDLARGEPFLTPLHALCDVRLSQPRGWRTVDQVDPDLLEECLSLMHKSGLDFNRRSREGNTALHFAINRWWAPFVHLLLRFGADPNVAFPGGSTTLHECGSLDVLRILVEQGGADINVQRPSDGKTPFLALANPWSGILTADSVRQFADLGADLSAKDHNGQGVLHVCLQPDRRHGRRDKLEVVDVLLAAGVSPDARDDAGMTPLHTLDGMDEKCLNLVSRFISAGVDLNTRDKQGRTPLYYYLLKAATRSDDNAVCALRKLIELGANVDAVDDNGRNLLYAIVESLDYSPQTMRLAKELVGLGVDPNKQDHEGNTLLHLAVGRCYKDSGNAIRPCKFVRELGTELHQKNRLGRTPVHLLSLPIPEASLADLDMFEEVDMKDHAGVRPLHIASKASVAAVHRFLDGGASPTEPTLEGMTPLHIAARFRQPEIVAVLVDAIEAANGKDGLSAHLNAFYRPGTPSALHLACRSGVPETVALLLKAGADPNLSDGQISSPLSWCTQFEAEESLWESRRNRIIAKRTKRQANQTKTAFSVELLDHIEARNVEEVARGIEIEDDFRGLFLGKRMSTRLDEVLDLLHGYGADMMTKDKDGRTSLDKAIIEAGFQEYTIECLVQLRQRLDGKSLVQTTKDRDLTASSIDATQLEAYISSRFPAQQSQNSLLGHLYPIISSLRRREATRRAVIDTKAWQGACEEKSLTQRGESLLETLIAQHDWASIITMLRSDGPAFPAIVKWKLLEDFACQGYVTVVRGAVTRENVAQLQKKQDDATRLAYEYDEGRLQLGRNRVHLLYNACKRPHGNMSMLRCLVEELGVDVNEARFIIRNGGSEKKTPTRLDSALHVLASGQHWWQVAEGLPYILSRGADIEQRCFDDKTALLYALGEKGRYRARVAKILIEAGADVNAVDRKGRNCLAHASDSVEITRLLLKHGAAVSPRALRNAINTFNDQVLEALLEAGSDPNGRQKTTEGAQTRYNLDCEMYPVFFASVMNRPYSLDEIEEVVQGQKHLSVVSLLLKHGAYPYARFEQPPEEKSGGASEEVVVIHEVIKQGGVVEPFLKLPDLDLEHRDARGRTLLLSACGSLVDQDLSVGQAYPDYSKHRDISAVTDTKSRQRSGPTVIRILLDKGASLMARDNEQKNALHALLEVKSFAGYESLAYILDRAPELLHQTDASGDTPLHYALQHVPIGNGGVDTRAIEMLLDAGADPLRLDSEGNTALHHLAKWISHDGEIFGDKDKPRTLFRRVLSLGVPINARNSKGETPAFCFVHHQIHHVRYHDYMDGGETSEGLQGKGLDILVEAGADFSAVNNAGETLLHVAAGMDKNVWMNSYHFGAGLGAELFRWLMERGVDPMAEDGGSKTALDVAATKEFARVLKMFRRPGEVDG